ncbi:MAG: hypothetical protein H6R26_213, partial [Proteobacteria bacterium]|nr:hypothetical protein [Pseudomonadota bacterium]
ADAIIADLSHDLTPQLSENVLWEVNRLWKSFRGEDPDSVKRNKLILIARGLEKIESRHPDRDFVYCSEIGKDWIRTMPTTASNFEDLLGFEVRRYSPKSNEHNRFIAWLDQRLRSLVQRIPAPVTDVDFLRHAQEINSFELDADESKWLRAISERNFELCKELLDSHEFPSNLVPLLGELIATVSISQSIEIPGYWGLAEKALKGSTTLRRYYRTLLAADQLSLCDPVRDPRNSSFCENVWHAFIGIANELPSEDKEDLVRLAEAEARMTIREVSDQFRFCYLPQNQQDDALMDLLMEHLKARDRDGK